MKGIAWLALVLAVGCQVDKGKPGEGAQAMRPEPTAATTSRAAQPFGPRNADARFFSRPADNWHEKQLELADYGLDVRVGDGIATVTLEVGVTNPTAAQAEAVIELPVPPGAAVTGATLWMGERPMAGVMLGSGKAREVYDRIVGRGRDPLLVAWADADMLSLSIFPLEAGQTRRLSVTWVEPAPTDRQWVPAFFEQGELVGFPRRIAVDGRPAEQAGNWVKIPRTAPASAGEFRLRFQEQTVPGKLVIVVDTSAAMAAAADWAREELAGLVAALEGKTEVSVLAADWLVRELGSVRTTAELPPVSAQLEAIRSAGLLDQRQALTRAAEIAGPTGVVAVISLQPPAAPPDASFAQPLYWVNTDPWPFGGDLVDRSGGRWVKSGAELAAAARPLLRPQEPGIEWLPLESAAGHVTWVGYRQGAEVDSDAAPPPAEALYYRALLRRGQIPPNKIVSPGTSILVLESEAHYRQWGVKDEAGKLVRDRPATRATLEALIDRGEELAPAAGGFGIGGGGTGSGTIGLGTIGTIGHGSGAGSGGGYGIGGSTMGRRSGGLPRVRIGTPIIGGDLDKNIIRRYIRRVLPRIRYCYEKQQLVHEELAGTVTVEFKITPQGKVVNAKAAMDHPRGASTSACIRDVIVTIQFPKPRGGGVVAVKYPFVFSPGPAILWAKARRWLEERAPGYEQKIGELFGGGAPTEAVALGWWLAEHHLRLQDAPPFAFAVVGELLRGGDATGAVADDARRVLSEGAARYTNEIADLFEQWGVPADAERVRTLWSPGNYGHLGFGGTGSGF